MAKLDPKKLPLGQDVEIRFIGKVFALDSNGDAGIKTPDGTIWAIPLNAKIYAADNIPGKVYFKNDAECTHPIKAWVHNNTKMQMERQCKSCEKVFSSETYDSLTARGIDYRYGIRG